MNCKRGFVKNITLVTRNDDAGRRLDRILRKALPDMPLSALHRLARKGKVLVNGVPARVEERIPSGARIELPLELSARRNESGQAIEEYPFRRPAEPKRSGRTPRADAHAGKLDIVWEGTGLLVLNKPSGLAVHGGGATPDNLEQRVRAYLKGKLPSSLSFRPGPLHRLDKPTSGIIVFALSLEGAKQFSSLLREGTVRKRYLAIVEGSLADREVWDDTLFRDKSLGKTFATAKTAGKGQRARCRVSPLAQRAPYATLPDSAALNGAARNNSVFTLIRVELETGRTHQIRAQAAAHGHPLAGDSKYGGKPLPGVAVSGGGFFLHARELELPEGPFPGTPRLFRAPLPEQFVLAVRRLFGDTCNKEDI